MRLLCAVFASLLPACLLAGIELSWSRSTCQPGDVIELHAVSSFEQLTSFELKLPRHESLHLVAHQPQPVNYEDGVYSQRSIWVLQPMQSGVVELSGIKALVQQGEQTEELDLPNQTIEVVGFAEQDSSFDAQPLPDVETSAETIFPVWLMLVAFVLAAVITALLRRRPVEASTTGSDAPTVEGLNAVLDAGQPPDALIEALLADESLDLSAGLRVAMERVVYHPNGDLEQLKRLVEQEVGS